MVKTYRQNKKAPSQVLFVIYSFLQVPLILQMVKLKYIILSIFYSSTSGYNIFISLSVKDNFEIM